MYKNIYNVFTCGSAVYLSMVDRMCIAVSQQYISDGQSGSNVPVKGVQIQL